MSEVSFPQAKRLFLNKVHQYVKDRLLDPKYACAFVFDIIGSQQPDFEEDKHNLVDIVQMCQQGKSRQLSVQSDASSPVVYPEHILPYLVHALAHHSSCPNVDECKDVKAFELIYRQMHLFLSMLVHGDEDGKSDASVNQQKEDISLVISLFQSIKRSEDAVDPAKSKYSHAICDLGLSITKRFVQKQDDLLDLSILASVPPMLYKPREKKEGDDTQVNEGKTWLADESVLTHFESLKLEANGTVHTEGVQDEALHDSEIDGNDVPLGKMIKLLKAKGTKARKEVKSESSQAKTKNENDVDILSMVREINLGNLGIISSKFESSNGHEYGHRDTKLDVKHKKKKRSGSELTDVPVPKRRRSSSALGAHRSNMKGKMSSTGKLPQAGVSSFDSIEMDEELPSSEDKISLQEDVVEPAESDLLVLSSSKHKGKSFDDEDDRDLKIPSKLVETDNKKATHNVKKRKRRSIAGLAKCTSKKGSDHTMDLIGCRIKIWWPMDKKFYVGVVKSFDTQKNKHVVLYDDGDVEVLRLEKERWELVDNGRKQPIKQSKLSKSPPPKALSPEQENKSSGGVQKNKQWTQMSSSSKVRGKRTPRKNPKHGKKEVAKGKASTEFDEASGGSPGVSDPEPDLNAKLDDANSGESEEEQIETTEKSIKGGEESDEDEISVSKEKQVRDAESSPSDTEESMQRNPDSGSKSIEDVADPTNDAQGSDEEESSRSEEKEQDITSIEENNREEKSDSQENEEDDTESNSTDPNRSSSTGEEEISDDEPLSTWKRRVGKSVEAK